ncbi:MAG: hypothetical protein K6E24_01725 [bacterium]|nr:hypothetical protein [bacterium]
MKKTALEFGLIYFVLELLVLIYVDVLLFNTHVPLTGVIALIVIIVNTFISLFLLFYSYFKLSINNRVLLGVLVMVFVFIPSGILLLCEHDDLIDDNNHTKSKLISDNNDLTPLRSDYKIGTFKCEICGNELKETYENIIIFNGRRKNICDNCLLEFEKKDENFSLVKESRSRKMNSN